MAEQYDFLPPLQEFPVLPGSDGDLFRFDNGLVPTLPPMNLPPSFSLDSPSKIDLPGASFSDDSLMDLSGAADSPRSYKSYDSPQLDSQDAPVKGEYKSKSKSDKKITRKQTSKQERQEQRKMKHRMIDRKRRLREKHSIDELKDLVIIHPSEKPDKATIVAGAVRTIKDLQDKIADLEQKLSQPQIEKASENVPLRTMIAALTGAGMTAVVVGLNDWIVKEVNTVFEAVSGFPRNQAVGTKFCEAPLYGRYVHGPFPREKFIRSSDPKQALAPTASSDDYTPSDFHQVLDVLSNGGTWKVVARHMSYDGYVIESFMNLMLIPGAILCVSGPDMRRKIALPQNGRRGILTPQAASSIGVTQGCQSQFYGFGMIPTAVAQPS